MVPMTPKLYDQLLRDNSDHRFAYILILIIGALNLAEALVDDRFVVASVLAVCVVGLGLAVRRLTRTRAQLNALATPMNVRADGRWRPIPQEGMNQ